MSVIIARSDVLATHAATALLQMYSQLDIEDVDPDAPDPGPRRVPRELRLWLAHLRLLESIPFSHLVADSALLPPESIRFFHLDRAWTDSLVEGALSVSTVTTGDRAILEAVYPVIRAEVDEAERLVRPVGWEPGKAVASGDAGPVTGFILRSRLVSGWPALSVRGYAIDNRHPGSGRAAKADDAVTEGDDALYQKLTTLRFERLAPAALLVLFDGLPRVVHIEEPRAGIQFGVDPGEITTSGTTKRARIRLRDATTSDRLPDVPANHKDIPFRKNAPGVLHIGELRKRISSVPATRVGTATADVDAAELAMQLLQFPFRSVYGDQDVPDPQGADLGVLFTPTIGYLELAEYYAQTRALPTPLTQWRGGV